MFKNKLIVGVPVYNDLENMRFMINSFLNSTNSYDKIILVESDSTDGSAKFCDDLRNIGSGVYKYINNLNIEVIHTPKLGPLDAYNRLFEIAKQEKADLFLTQTDVLFPSCFKRDWLKQMREISQIEQCGLVTCYGGGGMSGPDFINGFDWVGAWCTYIPYRTIEKIGGYDMNINLGYGVDIDYTYAVRQAGLKVYCINYWVDHHPNYDVAHEHERTNDFAKQKDEAFKYMKEKWKIGDYKI